MVIQALLIGGAIYGYWKQRYCTSTVEVLSNHPPELILQDQVDNAKHYSAVSTVSLGLVLAGAVTTSPALVLSSVPLIVYTNIPLFEEAFATISSKDEQRAAIIQVLLVSAVLSSNYFISASMLDWATQRIRLAAARVHQFSAQAADDVLLGSNSWVAQLFGRKPDKVWVVDGQSEVEIRFADLQVGDEVIFREGNFVCVTGEITRGEAEVIDWSRQTGQQTRLTVGDVARPRTLLLNGILYVRVSSVA